MWTEAAHKSAKNVEAKFVKTSSKEETKPGAKIKQVVEVFGDFTTPSQELSRNCPNPQFTLDSKTAQYVMLPKTLLNPIMPRLPNCTN